MKVVGITGGIGSGKTYVSQLLHERYGTPIYNCDNEAKRLTVESAEIRQRLIALLGTEVYLPNGQINKPLLAQYLFSNKQNAERVNAIIHPVVRQDFLQWKDKQASTLLLESAILMESHFDDLCDDIIIVSAPLELRIERACKRDNATTEAVTQRIAAQLSDEDRLAMARNTTNVYLVNNDGSPLDQKLEEIINKI